MENFGDYLKTQRERKGIRLEEIASITKIHLHSLELLETGRWEQLPPEPFIRGFITAYAKYVDLDPKQTLELFYERTGRTKQATPIELPEHQKPTTQNRTEEANSSPHDVISKDKYTASQQILTAAAVIGIVGVGSILIYLGRHAAQKQTSVAIQTPPAQTTTAETKPTPAASEDRVVATQQAVPAAADAEFKHVITVEGKERTWVKLVIDANPPTEFFLPEGEKATYQAKEKIKLVLGNSSGTKVMYNGHGVEGSKFMGTIRSFRFPSDAKFPQDVTKKPASDPNAEASNATTEAGNTQQ